MKKFTFSLLLSLGLANDLDMNSSVVANFGDSYDFYSFSENRLDLNVFYKEIQAW